MNHCLLYFLFFPFLLLSAWVDEQLLELDDQFQIITFLPQNLPDYRPRFHFRYLGHYPLALIVRLA